MGQPHPQFGNVEGLEVHSRVPPQPQTAARQALDPALFRGPMRTCGLPGDAHHQGNKYPALALAAASVFPVFVTWHSIFVPTARPHSP